MSLTPVRSTSQQSTYVRVAGLGFATGLRALTPLALLARTLQRGGLRGAPLRPAWGRSGVLSSGRAAGLLGLLAIGELIGDKVPSAPSRLSRGGLISRLVVGGIVGWETGSVLGGNKLVAALLGAASAGTGAWVGYHVRQWADGVTDWPDAVWAVVEDGLTVLLASRSLI